MPLRAIDIKRTPTVSTASAPECAPSIPLPQFPSYREPATLTGLLGVPHVTKRPPIRQSSVIDYEGCVRRGLLSTVYRLRPTGRSSAMDKGSYAHLMLRHLCEGYSKGENGRPNGIEACMGGYRAILESRPNPDEEWLDERRTDLNVGIAMGLYVWAHEVRPRLEKGLLKIVGSELPLCGRLQNNMVGSTAAWKKYKVAGQIDLLVEDQGGGIWILDLKTAKIGQDMEEWAESCSRRIQPHIYTYGLRSAGPRAWRDRIRGFLYLVLAKPGIKPHIARGAKPAETTEEFVARVNDWYQATGKHSDRQYLESAENPACAVIEAPVPDVPQPWLAPRLDRMLKFQRLSPERQWVLVSEGACVSGYGPCKFKRICDAAPKDYARIVRDYYTTTRDPLDSDPNR